MVTLATDVDHGLFDDILRGLVLCLHLGSRANGKRSRGGEDGIGVQADGERQMASGGRECLRVRVQAKC